MDRQIDLDSHGKESWECLLVSGNSSVAYLSDWRSVLRLVALMLGAPEYPDMGNPNFWVRMLISRVDFGDVGRNGAMDFSAPRM